MSASPHDIFDLASGTMATIVRDSGLWPQDTAYTYEQLDAIRLEAYTFLKDKTFDTWQDGWQLFLESKGKPGQI